MSGDFANEIPRQFARAARKIGTSSTFLKKSFDYIFLECCTIHHLHFLNIFLTMFLNISYYIGARSAENLQNISSTFLKKLLTNGRAQRGKFLNISSTFL